MRVPDEGEGLSVASNRVSRVLALWTEFLLAIGAATSSRRVSTVWNADLRLGILTPLNQTYRAFIRGIDQHFLDGVSQG